MTYQGQRLHVMILDYHKGGLQLWVGTPVLAGMDVRIQGEMFDIEGQVLWYQNKNAGVSLSRPMDDAFRSVLAMARSNAAAPK